jgi:hypothetical protein
MQMRVVVSDAARVPALAERLSVALGSERISFGSDRREVLVEQESDRGVLHVIRAVERWYGETQVGSVEMWLGERSYRFARWMPAETWP